jgi:predicted MFS family arabinose efflux permease
MMLIGALYPLGSIVQGAIADEIGLRATTTGAAVLLGALLLAWRVLRPRASHAIGDTITAAATTGGLDGVVAHQAETSKLEPGSEPAV